MSRRSQVADAQVARRARAFAAGLCAVCCKYEHQPGIRTCARCIEVARRSRARRMTWVREAKPVVQLLRGQRAKPTMLIVHGNLPRAVEDTAPFDVEADRREEWIALNELSLMRRAI